MFSVDVNIYIIIINIIIFAGLQWEDLQQKSKTDRRIIWKSK